MQGPVNSSNCTEKGVPDATELKFFRFRVDFHPWIAVCTPELRVGEVCCLKCCTELSRMGTKV
jgi:hypothetical protein